MTGTPTSQTTPAPAWNDLPGQLRGWREVDGMSDDARRKLWLMCKAADEIDRLRERIATIQRVWSMYPVKMMEEVFNAE